MELANWGSGRVGTASMQCGVVCSARLKRGAKREGLPHLSRGRELHELSAHAGIPLSGPTEASSSPAVSCAALGTQTLTQHTGQQHDTRLTTEMAALLDDGLSGPLKQTIYENTYRTEPQEVRCQAGCSPGGTSSHRERRRQRAHCRRPLRCALLQEARLRVHRVQAILKNLVRERLTGQVYDPVRMSQTTKQLAGGCLPATAESLRGVPAHLPVPPACPAPTSRPPLPLQTTSGSGSRRWALTATNWWCM